MASARPRIEVVPYNGALSTSSSDGSNEGMVCGCLLPDYASDREVCLGGSGLDGGHGSHGSGGSSGSIGSASNNSSGNCLTFSVDILSSAEAEMEDITSNCLLNVQDAAASTGGRRQCISESSA